MIAKAMVLDQFGEKLKMKEIKIPNLNNNEILVEIISSGICGSDLEISEGQDKRTKLPIILGHEGLGFIKELTADTRDINGVKLEKGDIIIWNRGVTCGKCYYCSIKKQPYLCQERWTYGISKSINEYPYLNGCFSTHVILTPDVEIIKLGNIDKDKKEDFISYVSISCAGSTTACMFEQTDVSIGDTVVIQGPGALGMYAVAFAKMRGASKVVVVGGTEERLKACTEIGADMVINRRKTTEEERIDTINKITDGKMADYVFEVAGSTYAVEEGIKYVGVAGTYVSSGISVPGEKICTDWFNITKKNITLKGIWVSDIKHTYQALKVFEANKENFSKMVDKKFKLQEANDALDCLKNKETVKPVLLP